MEQRSYSTLLSQTDLIYKNDSITLDGAIRLAEGILRGAYKDYERVLKRIMAYESLKRKSIEETNEYISLLKEKKRCEDFYRSEWFEILSLGMVEPNYVIERIQKKVGFIK